MTKYGYSVVINGKLFPMFFLSQRAITRALDVVTSQTLSNHFSKGATYENTSKGILIQKCPIDKHLKRGKPFKGYCKK